MTLTLKNIGRRIQQDWIVRNIDLHIKNGECLAILGPSGCGKSSTLRLVAGLDKPNEGKIFIDNVDVTNVSPVDRKIGMVFQSYALFPHLSVFSNLSLGLQIRGVAESEKTRRVNSILSIMQIDHLANRFPSELSGGQRQRVALARALLRDPLVYLLDEPMSNLDSQLREELRPELRNLILKGNKPVIYVTHDQQEAMAMADRIAVLNNGSIEQVGTPQNLYNKPRSIFVASFVGRPQINIINSMNKYIQAIRPEDIKFSSKGLRCELVGKEWLGTNQLLFLTSSYGTIRMSCDSNIHIPKEINITWEPQKEHIFDSKTGERLNNHC